MAHHLAHARGSIYVAVLGASMLVAIVGVSAVLAVRIQQRTASTSSDFSDARLYARSAVDIGMFWISQDPHWRTTRNSGLWADHLPMGGGSFSLQVVDPIDNNVANSDTDPVLLIGTGYKGDARYTVQTQLETSRGLACLEVSMHAGNNVKFSDVLVNSDQIISANHDISAGGTTQVYADVQAANNLSGGTYLGATATATALRDMPDASNAFNYYLAHGTPISYNDLSVGGINLLANPGIESGITDWSATNGSTITVDSTTRKSGLNSLIVSNRLLPSAGVAQNITARIVSGVAYHLEAHVRNAVKDATVSDIKLILRVQYKSTATSAVTTVAWASAAQSVGDKWKRLEIDVTPAWTGTLVKAEFTIETSTSLQSFRMDDAAFIELTSSTDHRLQRTVLSPQSNPYGSGTTNAEGIYIIDCLGKTLVIEDCRIVGTLLLINAASNSVVQGSVHWTPAIENYPALLTDKPITIKTAAAGLSESSINQNFNPPLTPYPYPTGSEDDDVTDAYPSIIRGLIYSKDNLVFSEAPTIDGVVLVERDIQANATSLDLRYNAIFLNDPPPGFDVVERKLELVPGSWQRLVQ